MKKIYSLLILFVTSTAFAQIPANYYSTATGTGYTLKTQLKRIIDSNDDGLSPEYLHNDQGYDAMDGFIANYDLDNYYEANSNTILDPYSENPTGTDPYAYTPVANECGNYNSEGDCYNKEHVIPQSVFNQATPMRSDAHELLPTDGRVNGFRSNYPFGVVDNSSLVNQSGISNPTQNGSKLGANLNSGYSAGYTGTVFEPIDEFKGDIARIHFYFATRYEDRIASWGSYAMFNGTSDEVFDPAFLSILLQWHAMDPVSQKEIDRNNNIFNNHQSNRNPFIDHPEYVNAIWSATIDDEAPSAPTNLVATNPTSSSIDLSWTAATDNVGVTTYDIYVDGVNSYNTTATSYTVAGLTAETNYCFLIIAKDAAENVSDFSNEACETTLENGTPGGGDCASESFTNIGAGSSQYSDFSWTGDNGVLWSATEARTDQTINSDTALTIDVREDNYGSLTSATVSGGIGSLTITTQQKFSGSAGSLNVFVNNASIGTIPYDVDPITTTIPNINLEGNVVVVISEEDPTSGARVALDNLSWTCYTNLSTDEFNLSEVTIYPNPVKNVLNINFPNANETRISIYNVLGKKVISKEFSKSTGTINTEKLSNGIYIIRIQQGPNTLSKKLIKR
ncbi:endonuclease [Bizionia sp. KMM 8389]